MLEKDNKAILEKIVALQKEYVSACGALSGLKTLETETRSAFNKTSRELKTALKDSRIGDKTIKNAENEIAVLKKKISGMDSDLEFVDQELKNTSTDADKLSADKNHMVENLTRIKSQLQQTMGVFGESEKELGEIFSHIEALKAQKTALTSEISEKLSNVAIDKEQSDKALDVFSMDFGRLAIEREDVKGTLNKREDVLSTLKDEIATLGEECNSMEEVVELEKKKALFEADVKNLQVEKETSFEKATGLEKALSQKEAELTLILSDKTEKETLAETLADEVGEFDELATNAKVCENERGEAAASVEEAISHLKERFANGIGTEREVGLKWGLSS
ncbi:MAG: hypothetical protein HN366_12600 [Deltaproteobacteria bacterium]|jgi:chromosome segregation ATPase|nr:hypothetical protein [Deltaproteobacteria bacterium]